MGLREDDYPQAFLGLKLRLKGFLRQKFLLYYLWLQYLQMWTCRQLQFRDESWAAAGNNWLR